MAKIFGYNYSSHAVTGTLTLEDMQAAFNIDFQSNRFLLNKRAGAGVGILNESDCQPVMLKRGDVDIVFMGRIFNTKKETDRIFTEIKRSVLVRDMSLLKYNLRKINGIFIMFIFDARENRIFLINDRYGMEPLYYYMDKDRLIFASEIKAILEDKTIKREVNWDFWRDFFQYGFGIGNKTPFNKISNLSGATILSFKEGDSEAASYWGYEEIMVDHGLSEEEAIDWGSDVIKNVFTRQSNGLDSCIVFLSGGYDSRCISSALNNFTGVRFETFSTSLHPSGRIESSLAQKVSDRLGVRFNYVGKIKDLYQDYFDKHIIQLDGLCTEHMWIIPLVESIEKNVANFDGTGGDVLLKNVSATKQNIGQFDDNDRIIDILNKEMIAYWSGKSCQDIYKYFSGDISKKIRPCTDSLHDEVYSLNQSENKIINFYLLNRTRNVAALAARHLIGRKAYSYFPFFDNEFVEYSLSLPSEMKYFNSIYRRILEKLFPGIMEIPTTNDKTLKMRLQNTLTGMLGWKNYSRILDVYKKLLVIIDPRDFYGEGMRYLRVSLEKIKMPPFVDRDNLVRKVNSDIRYRNNPKLYMAKILQFCNWYTKYF